MWSFFKLLLWGAAWFIVWLIALPWRRGRNNCLTWALEKWDDEGGYLVIRWCRHNKFKFIRWPHFLWLEEENNKYLKHVIPINDDPNERHLFPCPWFVPDEKTGDDEQNVEN